MGVIVVGYDESACARNALGRALELAAGLGDDVVIAYGYAAPGARRGEEFHELRAALRELGEHALAEAVEEAGSSGVLIETELVEARAAEALAELARERDARMIVVGTHGERPLAAAVLGSTPHRLLQLADVPVLVVPFRE